ncbi:MAG: SpoIID/LytB domain-containing protein [Candidatus Neomarinimicrobiota bacterium]
MLKKGIIPTSEPIVSIGLVLPIDKQPTIKIQCTKKNQNYSIGICKDYLTVNGNKTKQFKLEEAYNESRYILKPIYAGRGFHWQKKIKISVQGCLRIKNLGGFLFIVNDIGLESYLKCVATSEMSGHCPIALLKAQTIAARSWLIASKEQKHKKLNIDACNDDCCQRYQGIENISKEAELAVIQTQGSFITYENEICDARYSKSCGGITENNENVWNDEARPYLRSIYDSKKQMNIDLSNMDNMKNWFAKKHDCYCNNDHVNLSILKRYLGSVDKKGNYFRWEYTFTKNQIRDIINQKLNMSFNSIEKITPLKRGVSGRIIELKISGNIKKQSYDLIINSEYEIRNALHPKFLYSSAFIINANSDSKRDEDKITLNGAGWGHGVGLCQIGALGMALSGKSSEQILKHYFSSTTITRFYD